MADHDDRRTMRRDKTFEVISLSIDGVPHRAHMLDVSAGGAQVHSRAPLEPTSEVVLKSDEIEARATVQWQAENGRGGLKFM